MKTLEEPPYLPVGTDVSAKYRGAFCEAKIKTAKRLVKVKVTFKQDSSTGEVHDEHIRGPLKVGAAVEVRNQDGVYQEATINKLTDASLYTVVFDDGDEKTLRRSSLCLKGARHFAESETLDQLPLTNPEHFGTPVIGKKGNRGRRSNPVQEEESSSSSSEEEEGDQRLNDELLGKVVCVDCVAAGDKKKAPWYPALVISPDCREEVALKKDSVLVRSFKDGKFYTVMRKDVREMDSGAVPKAEAGLKPAIDSALDFLRRGAVPGTWRMELKEDTSSSEEEDEGEAEEEEEGASSEEEEEEVEPFPEERDNFLQQLYKFMEDRGTPINKRPVLGYRNLNLFKLYRLVHKLGGFDNIDSGSIWKQVYQDLGIPVLNSAAGYNVKCAYRKYLYGFEEYCTSTGIAFRMELPRKLADKPGSKAEKKTEAGGLAAPPGAASPRAQAEQTPRTDSSPQDAHPDLCKEESTAGPGALGSNKLEPASPKREEAEDKGEDDRKRQEEEEDGDKSSGPQAEDIKSEGGNNQEDKEKLGDDSSQEGEGEEFECYPPGMKVQVRYGRGRNQKTYEATVKESDLEGGEVLYLVHYCGWNVRPASSSRCLATYPGFSGPNNRYDEWIKADKIIRPANKNAQKVKHRKKIKNKVDREKEQLERVAEQEDLSPPRNHRVPRSSRAGGPHDSKLDNSSSSKGADQSPARSPEGASALNGLQASGSSTDEDSEREEDEDGDNDEDEHLGPRSGHKKMGLLEDAHVKEHGEGGPPLEGSRTVGGERHQNPDSQESVDSGKRRGQLEPEAERGVRRRRAEGPGERTPKGQAKSKARGGGSRAGDWLPSGSPKRLEERGAGPREEGEPMSGSSSSEDEEAAPRELRPEEAPRQRTRAKGTPSKKYNGLKDKTKGGRPPAFWEVPEKRPKLALGSEERLPGRTKGQKDVWSSIQAQWPKKTLKELFSDSDTEAANSPPQAVPVQEDPRAEPGPEEKEGGEGKPEPDKTQEFPSSGSNSVLNTPPTTPESPSQAPGAAEAPGRPEPSAPPPAPPPLASAPPASPSPSGPGRTESVGGPSETDSSTVEVESLGGELQDLPQEDRMASPSMAFDGSFSSNSNSNCSLALSGSSQLEAEQRAKAAASQKRQRDPQVGSTSRKHKRSHKNGGVHSKKSRKAAHSSDSEDQATSESTAKSPSSKTHMAALKPAGRSPPSGHKYQKSGDSDHHHHHHHHHHHRESHARSPRVYKWSFQMSDLEKMSSLERIAFLQEKLQDIRNHYLSLKSEVASIDRRRKRLKKKERESVAAASSSSSSSSSSSPSSSSLTAAVMLTLADPVSGSSQNSGVSVECR
ncbi:hypothetical protein MATL_G00019350 [Megalops atlanticus]|uniref:ARID domain-containing protein n=1 Tax=Megalops atlanticus TaxID=7932 RepID=A0A9D3TI70_MEGAT|nr:hypothetical protein MATL_G00019350 [Megalops atlanticus]